MQIRVQVRTCKQKQPPAVFCKKGVLKNFANFTGKHLCWSLFVKICCRSHFENTYFEEYLQTTAV